MINITFKTVSKMIHHINNYRPTMTYVYKSQYVKPIVSIAKFITGKYIS